MAHEDPAGRQRDAGAPGPRSRRDPIFESVPGPRSRIMQAIRGCDTGPELRVRSFLHKQGIRFRLRSRGLPCRPDIILPSARIALFVHGCFWHQHPGCAHATMPRVRAKYWEPKLARNRARDLECSRALTALGWKVLIVWECELEDQRLADLAVAIKHERSLRPT